MNALPIDAAAHAAGMVDLQFDLLGERMPAEHGYVLYRAIAAHLPWLAEAAHAGIHSVRAAAIGGGMLGLSRRVKLALRVPRERMKQALTLEGRRLDLGGTALQVGAVRERAIEPWNTLYARLTIAGPDDEAAFAAALRARLAAARQNCEIVLGRRASLHTPEGSRGGYAVMLHGVDLRDSIVLQEQGIGEHRLYGCGILVPYRNVGSVRD